MADWSDDRMAEIEEMGSEAVWRTTELRQARPNWTSFRDASLIDDKAAQLLIRFQREPFHTQGAFVLEDSQSFCQAFLLVLRSVTNQEAVLYVLTTLDELMKENRDLGKLFSSLVGTNLDPFAVLADLVSKDDDLLVARACNVIVHLFNANLPAGPQSVRQLMDFVRNETQRESRHKKFCFLAIVSVLQALLRDNERRTMFYEAQGLQMLISMIKAQQQNPQLLYQLCACIWLLSYSPDLKSKIADMEVVALLVHVLKNTQKEKVIRMILGMMVNLLETRDMNNILSVCGCQRLLESMKQRTWSDEDITNDIDTLLDKVGQSVEATSTFDEYRKEVMSGELEWTPMHRSGGFWEKNVHKFLEKDSQVLKALVDLIKPGSVSDSKVLSIALHDVGEFVRAHPGGKTHITKLNAKPYIMQHLTSSDPAINKEALTCVQKLMVH